MDTGKQFLLSEPFEVRLSDLTNYNPARPELWESLIQHGFVFVKLSLRKNKNKQNLSEILPRKGYKTGKWELLTLWLEIISKTGLEIIICFYKASSNSSTKTELPTPWEKSGCAIGKNSLFLILTFLLTYVTTILWQ